jgi:pimeloyl-ACP methyl ester carboxylesterase
VGDASDGDDDALLESSADAGVSSTPTSASSAHSAVSASSGAAASLHLIEGVIAENPFLSREACVSDILHKLLGRPPRILAPLLAPLQSIFVACIVLIVRFRLGLFAVTKVDTWAYNWRRAQGAHERVHQSLTRTGAHVSPSSAHMPLPSLSSRSAPLSTQAGVMDLSPLDLVDRLAPRPLLLMHGMRDQIIAPVHSQVLFQHARDSKKLWLVADAHHTAIHDAVPDEWQRTVLLWLQEHGF